MTFKRAFIAGMMQGQKTGTSIRDQGYRKRISASFLEHFPQAECFDPLLLVSQHIERAGPALSQRYEELVAAESFSVSTAPTVILEIRSLFLKMTREAGLCDLCIVYLPDHEPSMGTAMEMYAARLGGAQVVTISPMRQNLAILSTSDEILGDFQSLDTWLAHAAIAQRPD